MPSSTIRFLGLHAVRSHFFRIRKPFLMAFAASSPASFIRWLLRKD